MSQAPQGTRRRLVIVVTAVVLVALAAAGIAWWRGGDDDGRSAPSASASAGPDAPQEPAQTSSSATPSPEAPRAEVSTGPDPTCEGKGTLFNQEGVRQESLLPDCGQRPVSTQQEKRAGLGLGCGGRYPSILFKTTTAQAKASVCGKDSSGEVFRVVVREGDGDVLDMAGEYDPQRDAFVGRHDGVRYLVEGPTGDLYVTRDGVTTKQASTDWISLDNEPDGD